MKKEYYSAVFIFSFCRSTEKYENIGLVGLKDD
jgi:hypothetical protein